MRKILFPVLLLLIVASFLRTTAIKANVVINVTVNAAPGISADKPDIEDAKKYLIGDCERWLKVWGDLPSSITASPSMTDKDKAILFMYLCIKFVRAGTWWTKELEGHKLFVNYCIKPGDIIVKATGSFTDSHRHKRYRDRIVKLGLQGQGRTDWVLTVVKTGQLGEVKLKKGKVTPGAVVFSSEGRTGYFSGLIGEFLIREDQPRSRRKLIHELGHLLLLSDGLRGIMGGSPYTKSALTDYPLETNSNIRRSLTDTWSPLIGSPGTPPQCACCVNFESSGETRLPPREEIPRVPGRPEKNRPQTPERDGRSGKHER